MAAENSKTCLACRYGTAFDYDGTDGDYGFCHRYPPAIKDQNVGREYWSFPSVRAGQWCAEFKRRKDNHGR
jgi:hypothetical protein